jgi:hypothetical protein
MNAWHDYINHKIDVSKELDADINFPKIHLMSHWVEVLRRYGAMQQYSGERHEQAHQTNLKESWNASDRNLNYLWQAITFHCHILCFKIRERNLQALTQHRGNSVATCKVLPFGAALAASLGSLPHVKPKFMGPKNRCDGKHSATMIKDFRALLDNMQDTTHHMAIYNGTREFLTHKSCNHTYISDEQLHAMELCIYHCIKVQVEGLEGEPISQIGQCTGSQSWRGGDQWNDRVRVNQRPERCYGALNCCLRWQLQRLFKIKLLNYDGAFVEYWLPRALTTIPENSCNLYPLSTLVQVKKALAAVTLQVFCVGNIVGCTHLIPERAARSITGDEPSATTLVSIRNTRVFRTALTALTEPRTL